MVIVGDGGGVGEGERWSPRIEKAVCREMKRRKNESSWLRCSAVRTDELGFIEEAENELL